MATMRFGVLTVSDSCYGHPENDKSGPNLIKIIQESFPQSTANMIGIIPDHLQLIEYTLRDNTTDNSPYDVILTTGGTGFAPRDVTPEATKAVIDKEAPGLSYTMLSKSLAITDMAMLSRAVCGIRNHTLIINLPGSVKGSSECFNFVKSVISHAVALIKGDISAVKSTHKIIQGGSIENISESKVILKKSAFRHRVSPYPMLEVKAAQAKILENCKQSNEIESICIKKAFGRILACSVEAICDLPPFPASIKDGYAVVFSDGAGVRKVRDSVAAGDAPNSNPIKSGEIIRISTGAPVPPGADAVVQVEDTKVVTSTPDGDELEVKICDAPKKGQDIRPAGSDIKKGTIVMNKGEKLTAAHIGVLATLDLMKVSVMKLPKIGVLSTGNELVPPGTPAKHGQIRDSNKYTLMELLKQFGFESNDEGIAVDTPTAVKIALTKAFQHNEVIITTGGVSMGEHDVIKEVLVADFGATIHFGRVNMKPGKPTTFATCEFQGRTKLIFGLPGNPVSAMTTTILFVLPALKFIVGDSKRQLPIVRAKLEDWSGVLDERPEYVRVSLEYCTETQIFIAKTTGNQISSRLNSYIGANGLLHLPGKEEVDASSINKNYVFDVIVINLS